MGYYFLGIALIIFTAFTSLLIKDSKKKLKYATVCTVISSVLACIEAIKVFLSNVPTETILYCGKIINFVRFEIDGLSAFFIIFISVMSAISVIYANGYLKNYIDKGKDINAHIVFLLMLIASMLGVVTCQNALLFLIIWEIMSLSSFFLVIFENNKKEVLKAGIKYMIYMHISIIFITVTFALLSNAALSTDFHSYTKILTENRNFANLIFITAFIGFGIKAGFVPFHNWLPEAHPAAPSHVSGIMSGVMIKTGIYGILRILSLMIVPTLELGLFVLVISLISALYGVIYAIGQHDLKKLLAYHSIENIGIIGLGIGVGMIGLTFANYPVAILGFAGAILHVLNHSIFKELLFLAAGSVYTQTHTKDIEILGGLIKSMPKTAVLFLIASIAICGLPPFNGFISEFLIYLGFLKSLLINNVSVFLTVLIAIAGLGLIGTMAILCFTKAFSIIFLGEARTETAKKVTNDTPNIFIIPMSILAVFIVIIGLFPQFIFKMLYYPVSSFGISFNEIAQYTYISDIMQKVSFIAASMLITIIAAIFIKKIIYKNQIKHTTWGCGYNRLNPKMQYSASSYAEPFLGSLKPLFKKIADIKKPKSLFPNEAHYATHIEDIEEEYFIKPFVHFNEDFLAKFEKLQNGDLQQYLKFGLIFLVLALIGVFTI